MEEKKGKPDEPKKVEPDIPSRGIKCGKYIPQIKGKEDHGQYILIPSNPQSSRSKHSK